MPFNSVVSENIFLKDFEVLKNIRTLTLESFVLANFCIHYRSLHLAFQKKKKILVTIGHDL